jgi:hypothetical protein
MVGSQAMQIHGASQRVGPGAVVDPHAPDRTERDPSGFGRHDDPLYFGEKGRFLKLHVRHSRLTP